MCMCLREKELDWERARQLFKQFSLICTFLLRHTKTLQGEQSSLALTFELHGGSSNCFRLVLFQASKTLSIALYILLQCPFGEYEHIHILFQFLSCTNCLLQGRMLHHVQTCMFFNIKIHMDGNAFNLAFRLFLFSLPPPLFSLFLFYFSNFSIP